MLKSTGNTQVHGTRRDASEHAAGPGQCHCKAPLCCLPKTEVMMGGPRGLAKKGKHHTSSGRRIWGTPQQPPPPQSLRTSLSKSSQKNKKVIGNSQRGFTGGKLHCAILMAFSDETTSCADKRGAGNGAHPEFRTFDAHSRSILTDVLIGHKLDKVGGKLSGLTGCDQRYKVQPVASS